MSFAQIVVDGVVTNVIAVDSNAIVTRDGMALAWGDTELPAPAGGVFMMVDGVGIGWRLDNGVLVPPLSSMEPPASKAELAAYAEAVQAALLGAGILVDVAADGAPPVNVLVDGRSSTRADLGLLALYGQSNPAGSKTWVDNRGASTVLSGEQLVVLATRAGDWVAATYAFLGAVLAQIADGSIATHAQIEALQWPQA